MRWRWACAAVAAIASFSDAAGHAGVDETAPRAPLSGSKSSSSSSSRREYGIFAALQYYDPVLPQEVYDRIAAAAKLVPVFVSVCADHNDTGGGAEHRTGDPRDGGRIVPLCDLGDAEGAAVRARLGTLRAAGVRVLHYTHTRLAYYPNGTEYACCECCEDLPYVVSRVANETKTFPQDGIFIDNAVANEAWSRYYGAIVARARAADPTRVIATNPNCAHPHSERCSPFCSSFGHSAAMCADCANPRCSNMTAEWFDYADVHLLSEASLERGGPPDFVVDLPFESTDAQRSKFSMMTYGATEGEWRGLIDRARAKGFSKFWVTAKGSSGALPPWFEDMAKYIASFNTG